jgi:hypothetical protein
MPRRARHRCEDNLRSATENEKPCDIRDIGIMADIDHKIRGRSPVGREWDQRRSVLDRIGHMKEEVGALTRFGPHLSSASVQRRFSSRSWLHLLLCSYGNGPFQYIVPDPLPPPA